jgi:hypothetical protein
MATCCKGQATWFCTYPDGSCGTGACGTCNSGYWQYAWPAPLGCAPCGIGRTCGANLWLSDNCGTYYGASRCDTGPACWTGHMVDLTKALFLQFAPLSQGLINNMRATTDASCC